MTAKDAFGLALLDAAGGGAGRHRVERSDGAGEWRLASSYLSGREDWSPHVVEALDALTGRVLDVGCGAGRHATYLSARGCDVTGIDSSPVAVSICRERGIDAEVGRLGAWGTGGRESFDHVVLMGNNLGLLENAERAQGHLEWLAARCRRGATIVGEGLDVARTPGHPRGDVRLRVSFGACQSDWFAYWLLSPDELATAVAATRWALTDVVGGIAFMAKLRLQ